MKEFFPEYNGHATIKDINYPDRYRIDVSIEGKTDLFIIENKVNDVEEKCGQIYRYVNFAMSKYRPENIHVLYLNSQTHDYPTEKSRTKDGKGVTHIPENVNIKVISYKEEIVDWLENIYQKTSDREYYLKSALFQYIDYLKEKFKISKRHETMNHKLNSLIKDKLFTSDMSIMQRLNVLSDTKDQLDELKSYLEDIEEKEEIARFQEWFKELTSRYPSEEYDWVRDDEKDIHIDFNYQGYRLSASLTIDGGLCWGITDAKQRLPKKWVKEIHSQVLIYLPKAQCNDCWPAWDWTSYENGLTRYLQLLECVFSIEDAE